MYANSRRHQDEMDAIVSMPGSLDGFSEPASSGRSRSQQAAPSIAANSIVPDRGYMYTMASFLCLRLQIIQQAFKESFCSKIKAIFMCITLPCDMIFRPILAGGLSDRLKISHSGTIYFYLLLSCTIVFNLWEQRTKDSPPSLSYPFSQWFEFGCMVVSLIYMVYINCSTKGRVNFDSQEKGLILYFRIGLYVFGVSSLVYAMMNLLNYSYCSSPRNICISAAKFLYIVGQMLFLNRFDQAKLPDGPFIRIALAHIMGTNLSLWIWTLCKEVYDKEKDLCRSEPIQLGSTEKYFYPLFVEYLLLVASMIYELWVNVQTIPRTRGRCNLHYECIYENYQVEQTEIEETASENSQQATVQDRRLQISAERRRAKFTPSLAVSLILGIIFASVFIAFVLASSDSGKMKLHEQYIEFIIVNICMYCSQLLACYIALLSCQSQLPNENRGNIDLDDALLYFGLAGILLWEGFHLYGLIFSIDDNVEKIEYVNGVCGMLEDIAQTIVLLSIRQCRSRKDKNAKNICNCALFLLATNLAMWFQNSFYVEQNLENPGENHENLENTLVVFAHILNPLTIFFRFHSATCCYHMWTIFVTRDDDD